MKRAPTHCPTLGKLDNNLSPRVGDFAQKNHPRPKLPGGGTLGDTLDTSISDSDVEQEAINELDSDDENHEIWIFDDLL